MFSKDLVVSPFSLSLSPYLPKKVSHEQEGLSNRLIVAKTTLANFSTNIYCPKDYTSTRQCLYIYIYIPASPFSIL